MSESIQRQRHLVRSLEDPLGSPAGGCATLDAETVRRAFLEHAADLYGRPLAVDLADVDGLDDAAAVLLAFPWLDDAELHEALWALGQCRAGGDF